MENKKIQSYIDQCSHDNKEVTIEPYGYKICQKCFTKFRHALIMAYNMKEGENDKG